MRFFYSALLLLPLSGLLLAAAPTSNVEPQPSATITRLVLRDYQITISSGDNGTARYDVYATDGQALDTNLDLEALQASYPAIYDSLRPAIASDGEEAEHMILMMEQPEIDD